MPPSHSRQASRPESRASTTSATSQHHDGSRPPTQPKVTQHTYAHQGPEAAILQYLDHSNMRPQSSQQYETQHQPHQQFGMSQNAPYPALNNYLGHDNSSMHTDFGMGAPSIRQASVPLSVGTGPDGHDDKRRKGSAVTATNDKELREMLVKNEGRPLSEVAQEVIQKERTPFAEKTKQLFAMLWLRAVCKPAKTSVPRNRVYSQYATRCGTERVVPLNPASFGKLVRVIFPGIQTRRLGVRGESKYHYVDLALDEEPPSSYMQQSQQAQSVQSYNQPLIDTRPGRSDSAATQHIDFNSIPRLQADTASFPAPDASFDIQPQRPLTPRGPRSVARAFAYPDTRTMQPGSAEAMTYPHTLRFPSRDLPTFAENEPVNLPSIHPYLPPRTNVDDAEALVALYRTHCTSLIDSIRFCKEKQFFRLYTSFHGTLTVPVQKLFMHQNLAPWIEECDLVMYRTMVRFVSRLTLQAAPVIVINIMSNISGNLHSHISKTFASQPIHVLEAKLRPATIFASLLHRLIRVNQSAHAAANLLTIDQNRETMWREWVTMVNPKRVMEAELPDCGYDEVYKILTTEMRSLLEPLQAPAYHDDPYGFNAYQFEENGGFAQFLQGQTSQPSSRNGQSNVSTETVLDRWSAFITSLPSRFPHASTRTLLHCISAIGTAALRDITIMNGLSYAYWWVLKIFVDEMALWLAEMGGFLDSSALAAVPNAGAMSDTISTAPIFASPVLQDLQARAQSGRSSAPPMSNGNGHPFSGVSQGSRPHRANSNLNPSQRPFQERPQIQRSYSAHPQAPQQPQHHLATSELPLPLEHQSFSDHRHHTNHDADIDDSGIGMSLLDDDLAASKYGMSGAHGSGMEGMDMRVDPLC